MQVIPAVDVIDGRVVRLLRGEYGLATEYAADPVAAAGEWVTQGASLVHVVDLDGAREGSAGLGLAARLGEAGLPFQIGGGLRSVEDVVRVVEAGAARAVVGTAAVWQPELVGEMVTAVGAERVVAAIDVRGGQAEGGGWLDGGRPLAEVLAECVAAGLCSALVTAISRDGTMQGPDLGLLRRVAEMAPALEIIASGGVGTLDHVRSLAAAGIEAAIVGRALYEGRFTLGEALI